MVFGKVSKEPGFKGNRMETRRDQLTEGTRNQRPGFHVPRN